MPLRSIVRSSSASIIPILLAVLPAWSQTPTITLSPGMNIQKSVNANPENTTFLFQPGTYRLQSIQPKNGDVFIGQSNAILNGAQVLVFFVHQGNLWFVDGQTQQGQQNGSCDSQHPQCTHPEDLFVDSVPLLHVGSLSAVAPGSWFFDYPNHRIYMADNPIGHLVETSVTRSAFSGPATNVTITGLTVEKYAIPAQWGAIGDQYPGPNWTVSQNEVRWNHGAGISLADGSQAILNNVHHNGQKGIGGSGANQLVQGNQVSFSNWAGYDCAWECGGMKFALTVGLVLRGNIVHDNLGGGIWTDIDNMNTLYEGNTIMNNKGGPGIQHEISFAAIIRYNTVCNNSIPAGTNWLWGSEILIQNSQDVEVYQNTVEVPIGSSTLGGNGIGIIQQNRGFGPYGPYTASFNSIHNNTVVYRSAGNAGGLSGIVADYKLLELLADATNSFDYNTYHLVDPNWYHWLLGGGQTFVGFQMANMELHGSVDTLNPPTQCVATAGPATN